MSFLQRVRAAWNVLVSPPEPSNPDSLAALSKALEPARQKLVERKAVDRRARHKPFHSVTQAMGLAAPKVHGVSNQMLRNFVRNNPWLRAVIDIRKREIANADWGVVPKLDNHEKELEQLRQLCASVLRFPDRRDLLNSFENRALSPKMVRELINAGTVEGLSASELQYRFSLALSDLTRKAESHAAEIRPLFETPNVNNFSWSHILLALVPDILTLDSGCVEKRRLLRPETFPGSGRPRVTNPLLEFHWVDGATVFPCIDEQGLFRGIQNPSEHAYEQYIDGMLVEQSGWRHRDLMRIVENPQTDVNFLGHGFSRVETLVTTSMLQAMDDSSEMEELQRQFYGGFLNIADSGEDQHTLMEFSDYIQREWEGTRKLPVTNFQDAEFIKTESDSFGRDKSAVDRKRQKILRICALFEISPMKLGQFFSANYSTSETSQEHGDEGLQNLMAVIDRFINADIISEFGYDDVQYSSSVAHKRDVMKELEEAEKRQELGIDVVNKTRARFGEPPIEVGDKPAAYFKQYWGESGKRDGSTGGDHVVPEDEQEGGDGKTDEPSDPNNNPKAQQGKETVDG